MKLSPAWKLARRGKSAKLVLAASTRMNNVAIWRAPNRKFLPPNTCWPIWEMTVGVPLSNTTGFTRVARIESPRKSVPSVAPMMLRALRAFCHSGLRNAVTPFEIASTPVTAAPPEAKACRTTNNAAP